MSNKNVFAQIKRANAQKMKIIVCTYVSATGPTGHTISWNSNEVPASAMTGFIGAEGDIVLVAKQGGSLLILSAPSAGHWSDWITPAPYVFSVLATTPLSTIRHYERVARVGSYPAMGGPNASDFDFAVEGPMLLEAIDAGTGSTSSTSIPGDYYYARHTWDEQLGAADESGVDLQTARDRRGDRSTPPAHGPPFYYEDFIRQSATVGIGARHYADDNGDYLDPHPSELDSLTLGVDYAPVPGGAGDTDLVRYESGAAVRAWQTMHLDLQAYLFCTHHLVGVDGDTDTHTDVDLGGEPSDGVFDVIAQRSPGVVTDPFFPDAGAASVVVGSLTVTITAPDAGFASFSIDLNLAPLATWPEFWLYIRPPFLDPDVPSPLFVDSSGSPTITDDMQSRTALFQLAGIVRLTADSLTVQYQAPRFRYWVPPPI